MLLDTRQGSVLEGLALPVHSPHSPFISISRGGFLATGLQWTLQTCLLCSPESTCSICILGSCWPLNQYLLLPWRVFAGMLGILGLGMWLFHGFQYLHAT